MKSILDPSFKYTPSAETDIRKTFAKVRREQLAGKKLPPNVQVLPATKVKEKQ